MTNLTHLLLNQNQLSGEIPEELGGLTNLLQLWLHTNTLRGEIPAELGALTSLQQLLLHVNQLGGKIPAELRALTSLQILQLHVNQLSGKIPAALGALISLKYLHLNQNQLSGKIPTELGDLTNLRQLYLNDNKGLSCVWAGSEFHTWLTTIDSQGAVCVPLPEGELGATSVFAKRYRAGNVKITWNNITIDGAPLPPGKPDYAVTVSGGRRNTTWALSHLEILFGDPLSRGNRYTVQHPTSTSDNNNQSDHDVAFTYTLKVIGDEWLASGQTFLRIDCPAVGSANAVDCGLSTAPSVLRVRDGSGYEGRSPMAFGVELDPPSSGTVTVDYATADRPSGTRRARAGQDYDATSGTLTFAPGETKKIVAVGIIDDAVSDNGETFYLNFSNATGATLPDTQATGLIRNTEPLTASFEGVPEAHDGQSAFSVRVAFSEDIGISYQTLRDESFTTTGGAVTGARRVDGRHDLWEITVEPSGADDVTITLPRGRDCGTTGAVCTREDTPRALTNTPSATVKGPSASEGDPPSDPPDPSDPLTASFSGVPGEHTGERFTFGLTFSEDVAGLSFKTLRDAAFAVTGGDVRKAQRKQQGSSQGWTITVEPSGNEAVSIRLPAGSVETSDGAVLRAACRRRSTARRDRGRRCAGGREHARSAGLRVTLDRAASGTVTVDYATSNGTATAGADYTATSGTLRFAAGEQSKSVSVAVLDDDHDEGEETVTLTLSNASGARITDGTRPGRSRTGTRCRARCWRGSGGRRRCTWSSTSRNGSRRRASRASRAGSPAGRCGRGWSARWR